MSQEISPELRITSARKFAFFLAIVVAICAALPAIVNVLSAPSGSSYIGSIISTDDHMVYAAWMRQAMSGHILFDNRFTVDPQPGLTINLYFFAVGLIASVTGIVFATNLVRVGLSFLLVWLLYRLARKLNWDVYAVKLAIVLPVIGGGIGFLTWHSFGNQFVRPAPEALTSMTHGLLPIDVWQPEALVFPSMLSNGLFVAALCLIVTTFLCVVRAKENRRYVAIGAGCMFLLMNIHSYDALLVTFVLIGFAVATWFQKELTAAWVGRAVLIGLGAVPPALYFAYVLRNDAVFQARAATETFSSNFRVVLLGLLFPIVLGIAGLATREGDANATRSRRLGAGMFTVLLVAMFAASNSGTPGYLMSPGVWGVAFVWGLACVALLRDETPAMNIFISWAVLGTVAIYFPALFQRKLAMGIVIPWSVLAALGLAHLLKSQERNSRNLIAALAIILFGATSLRWAFREIQLASSNVSNTTMQPVYLSNNVQRILDYLNKLQGRHTVIAMPGIQSPAFYSKQQETVAGPQLAPIVPDLNPIVSGFAGDYTYAGHWSETPDYAKKRGLVTALFIQNLSDAQRANALKQTQADYVIAPTQESIPEIPIFDFSKIGNVVVDGPQFRLIKLNLAAG